MRPTKSASTAVGLLFASPWLIGFLLFLAYPLIISIYYSFTSFSVLKPPLWIGASNYTELAHDAVFRQAFANTILYTVASVPLATITAIGLALLLNLKVRGQGIYRTLFYLPSLVPMVALAILWLWILNSQYGLLNYGLASVHAPTPPWLTDPGWTKWSLVLISMWGCGNAMVIYLAGLQDIPVNLYEAAELDGTGPLRKIWHVTLPLLSPVILFNVVMAVIGSLQTFALPYVMFPGGQPARSAYFLSMYLYDNAFLYQRMGYASAIGWIMFLITFVLTMLAIKLSSRYVYYEGA